jgi:hypothetical protein
VWISSSSEIGDATPIAWSLWEKVVCVNVLSIEAMDSRSLGTSPVGRGLGVLVVLAGRGGRVVTGGWVSRRDGRSGRRSSNGRWRGCLGRGRGRGLSVRRAVALLLRLIALLRARVARLLLLDLRTRIALLLRLVTLLLLDLRASVRLLLVLHTWLLVLNLLLDLRLLVLDLLNLRLLILGLLNLRLLILDLLLGLAVRLIRLLLILGLLIRLLAVRLLILRLRVSVRLSAVALASVASAIRRLRVGLSIGLLPTIAARSVAARSIPARSVAARSISAAVSGRAV